MGRPASGRVRRGADALTPAGKRPPLRLAVYSDFEYGWDGEAVSADEAFVLFLAGLADALDSLVVLGRFHPDRGRMRYTLPRDVRLAPLPHYPELGRPLPVVRTAVKSMRRFWAVLDDVDAVWLIGPHPFSVAFAGLAAVRRKGVVLGVRQDFPRYVRMRHPGKAWLGYAATLLEHVYRLLGALFSVVVVGTELERNYRAASRLLTIAVSLVRERDMVERVGAAKRPAGGPTRILSVGRLDPEKNPLLLADVIAGLARGGESWRLVVCGEGSERTALERRLLALGVSDRVELRGYISLDEGLHELYRESDVLLHVSWTEGFPQVLLEAFAAGLPVVATAVGGVPDGVGDSALLVPPGDASAAEAAVRRVVGDPGLRARLVASGLERVRRRTLEAESRRVADFIAASVGAARQA